MSRKRKPHWVYFLRPIGAEGPIKIGCSQTPAERMSVYLSWSPVPLEMLATIAGSHNVERAFHAKFAHLWTHHEWFRPAPELLETIEQIRAGRFDVSTLPDDRRVPFGPAPATWPEWLQRSYRLATELRTTRKRGDTFIPQRVWNAANVLYSPDIEARVEAQAEVARFLEGGSL